MTNNNNKIFGVSTQVIEDGKASNNIWFTTSQKEAMEIMEAGVTGNGFNVTSTDYVDAEFFGTFCDVVAVMVGEKEGAQIRSAAFVVIVNESFCFPVVEVGGAE